MSKDKLLKELRYAKEGLEQMQYDYNHGKYGSVEQFIRDEGNQVAQIAKLEQKIAHIN